MWRATWKCAAAEALKIDWMIEEEMGAFANWLQTLGVRPVIRALQEKSTSIHESTMESLFNKLPELDERQRKVIRRLTKSIVNQMMHDPINRIKEMAGEEHGVEALEMFTQIFALEQQLEALSESSTAADQQNSATQEISTQEQKRRRKSRHSKQRPSFRS